MKKTLSLFEQSLFTQQLAFLLEASIPLVEALTLCQNQAKGVKKRILKKIRAEITNGKPLSKAISLHIENCSSILLAYIKTGEETGQLAPSMKKAALEIANILAVRKKIVAALFYPICILLVTVVLTSFLVFFIFPKIQPLLTSLHSDLPWNTKIIIEGSSIIKSYGLLFSGICIITYLMYKKMLAKRKFIISLRQTILLHIPIISSLIKNQQLALISKSLSRRLSAGVPLSEALLQLQSGLVIYDHTFKELSVSVKRGISYSQSLKIYPRLFPSFFVDLIQVGEATSMLPAILENCGSYFEEKTDHSLKTLSSLIEPLLMIVMGGSVGFIALGMITPLYGLSQTLSSH
jgi:type IV pilus assembly protein PilC